MDTALICNDSVCAVSSSDLRRAIKTEQHMPNELQDEEEEVHTCLLGHCEKAVYTSGFLLVDPCLAQLRSGGHATCQNYWTGTLQHIQSITTS